MFEIAIAFGIFAFSLLMLAMTVASVVSIWDGSF